MQEFLNIFAEIGWVSGTLLIVGLVLFIAECLTPGFGVAGISGLVCLIFGVVARAFEGASLMQILWLSIITIVLICGLFLLFVRSAQKGLISKTSIIEKGTALPTTLKESDLVKYLNKEGVTRSICRPIGKVEIDGNIIDAMTCGNFIDNNVKVVVMKAEYDYVYIQDVKFLDLKDKEKNNEGDKNEN